MSRGLGDVYKRQLIIQRTNAITIFQSTPSVGRATDIKLNDTDKFILFQSTPSVGRATSLDGISVIKCVFQSTPSVGRATSTDRENCYTDKISIHALRGEGDLLLKYIGAWISIFQSTPSVGRATFYYHLIQLQ